MQPVDTAVANAPRNGDVVIVYRATVSVVFKKKMFSEFMGYTDRS